MILNYALFFFCGLFTKFTDYLVDKPFGKKRGGLQHATGLLYGLLAGYLATSSQEFATLILGIVIAVLLAGKIDSRAHQLAIAAILGVVAFRGLPLVHFPLLALFAGLGFFDERLNDFMDKAKGKIRINKNVQHLVSARLSLEAGTLATGLATGNFVYFFGLLSFDLGYNLIGRAMAPGKR